MKRCLSLEELAILDLHACTADKLQELVEYVGRARPHIVELICRVLEVDEWDLHARQAIERFVASQPQPLETLLEELAAELRTEPH